MPQTVKISTFVRVMEAEGYVIEELVPGSPIGARCRVPGH